MVDVAAELARLEQRLRMQDNLCTAHPIYVVQRHVRDYGYDSDYTEDIAWVDAEGPPYVTHKSDPERFARFEEGVFDGSEDGREEMWTRTGFRDRWEFVQPFLTMEAAEAYRVSQAHNLGESRIYVDSGYRNTEWIALRAMLGSGELVRAVAAREFLQQYGELILRVFNEQGNGSAFDALLALARSEGGAKRSHEEEAAYKTSPA